MSQNILTTSSSIGQVTVIAGWDRPLQEFFCNVEPMAEHEGDYPECLLEINYSSAAAIAENLKLANITLPAQMVEAIERDGAAQAGNVMRHFREDGSIEDAVGETPPGSGQYRTARER
jgi:hypothetical protein